MQPQKLLEVRRAPTQAEAGGKKRDPLPCPEPEKEHADGVGIAEPERRPNVPMPGQELLSSLEVW